MASLGSVQVAPEAPLGLEHEVGFEAILGRLLTGGLRPGAWGRVKRPPDLDGYWAAKIISPETASRVAQMLAQRRDRIARIWFDKVPPLDFFRCEGTVVRFCDLGVERGIYQGTETGYLLRVTPVTARREEAPLGATWESVVPELDFEAREARAALRSGPEARYPFIAVECRVARGATASRPVTAYVARSSKRVVEVRR